MHTLPLFSALVLIHSFHLPAFAVTTLVDRREKLCLWDVVPPKTRTTFHFHLADSKKNGMLATLRDQNGTELVRWDKALLGNYEVPSRAEAAAVHACFENTDQRGTYRRVSFHFHSHLDYGLVPGGDKLLDPVERLVENVAKRMRKVQVRQEDLQAIQRAHKEVVDSTEKWMLLWSLFQMISLLVVSIFQMYFLKFFLERKTFV